MTGVMFTGAETLNSCAMDSGPAATPEQVLGTCLRLELEAAALCRRFLPA